jgi:hypothetical protein
VRKLALSGLVAVAAVLGSAIPAAASTASTPAAAAAAAVTRPAVAATAAIAGPGGRISCASPTACLAVGSDINSAGNSTPIAETLHGTTWTSVAVKAPAGSVSTELTGVSCKAANYCLVDGDYTNKAGVDLPYVLTWNGSTLTAIVKAPLPAGDELTTIGGVSCVAVKSCVVFGSAASSTTLNGAVQLAWTWNGSAWGRKTAGGGSATDEFTAARCFTLTSCLEAGIDTNASGTETELLATWNGNSFTTQPVPAPGKASVLFPADLSCSSSKNCAVVGFGFNLSASSTSVPSIFGFLQVWNGSAWKVAQWAGPKGANFALLLGVSCTSASNCVAVGASGTNNSGAAASFTWNGTHWSPVGVPGVGKGLTTEFSSVSCPSAGTCVAIGAYGLPTAMNGTPLAGYLHAGSWRLQHA